MGSFDLKTYNNRVEILLNLVLSRNEPKKLFEAMKYSSLGGKHLRALLCYAISVDLIEAEQIEAIEPINQVNSDSSKYLFHPSDAIALAIELMHSYSLVHDDLPAMDNDDIRRGKASTHKAFGEATAILVGDGLQAYAFEILSYGSFDWVAFKQIIHYFSKSVGSEGMVGGQMLDIEPTDLNSESAIIQMYQLKTAKLITASILLPYLSIKDKQQSDQDNLEKIGDCLGLCFQIQDDLLEKSGADMGKPNDSDSRNQKNTLLSHLKPTKLQKMQQDLIKKIDNNLNQLSFNAKNLKALISQISQRGY